MVSLRYLKTLGNRVQTDVQAKKGKGCSGVWGLSKREEEDRSGISALFLLPQLTRFTIPFCRRPTVPYIFCRLQRSLFALASRRVARRRRHHWREKCSDGKFVAMLCTYSFTHSFSGGFVLRSTTVRPRLVHI